MNGSNVCKTRDVCNTPEPHTESASDGTYYIFFPQSKNFLSYVYLHL